MAARPLGAVFLGQDTRTLARMQVDCLAALQRAKALALAAMSYTPVSGATAYTVTLSTQDQVDVSTQLALLQASAAAAAAASPPQSAPTIQWEIVDGVFLTWGVSDVQALQQAGIAHVLGCYSNAAALTAKINAAASAADLPDVTQGWPT